MAEFVANPARLDPYKSFKFRIRWDGRVVAGISKVSALRQTAEVLEHRHGGDVSDAHKSPGQSSYEALTLERGVTHDPEFGKWANKVWDYGAAVGAEEPMAEIPKDVLIDMYNEAGQKVVSDKVYRCWVSEYEAVPDFNASGDAVAIQQIKLENEGWKRVEDVVEPSEPMI